MCTKMTAASAGAITFTAAQVAAAFATELQLVGGWFAHSLDHNPVKLEAASNGQVVSYTAAAGTAALYDVQNQDNVGLHVRPIATSFLDDRMMA